MAVDMNKAATKQDVKEAVEGILTEMRTFMNMVADRFDTVDKRFEAVDRRFEVVDQRFEAVDQRFEAVDKRFNAIDKRFEGVDRRFAEMDKKFTKRFAEMDDKFTKRFDEMDKKFTKRFGDVGISLDDLTAVLKNIEDKVKTLGAESKKLFEEARRIFAFLHSLERRVQISEEERLLATHQTKRAFDCLRQLAKKVGVELKV